MNELSGTLTAVTLDGPDLNGEEQIVAKTTTVTIKFQGDFSRTAFSAALEAMQQGRTVTVDFSEAGLNP